MVWRRSWSRTSSKNCIVLSAITTLQAYMEASPSQLEPAPQAAPPADAEAAAGTEPAPASEGGKA